MRERLPAFFHKLSDNDQLLASLGYLKESLQDRPDSLDRQLAASMDHVSMIIGVNEDLPPDDATEIGELAMNLLEGLYYEIHEQEEDRTLFNYIALGLSYWVARKGGKIRQLEHIVNALAESASTLLDKTSLEALYEATSFIVAATDESVREPSENGLPASPWKVLMFNYAIIATRTHTPDLIEASYPLLIKAFPDAAGNFLDEAMSEMDRLNYPPHVRTVVARFHEQYT